MAINANKVPSTGGGFRQEPLEVGPYDARIVRVIDLGLQEMSFRGESKDPARKISVTYELLDEFMVDEDGAVQEDKPRFLSEEMPLYSLGADRAKSTIRYLALDPQQVHKGDWEQLINTPCVVTVVNNPGRGKNEGRVFNNVGNISPMRAKNAENAPPLVNAAQFFDLESPDMEIYDSQPDFLKEKIQANLEFQGSALQVALGGVPAADTGGDAYMDEGTPKSFE